MPQSSYPFDMPLGYVGGRADGDIYSALSYIAAGPIAFGVAVVAALTVASTFGQGARLPGVGSLTLTLSTDLITGNVVNGAVVVTNAAGVSTTTALSATTYATSHAATMAVLAGKIAALTGVASATPASDVLTVVASPDYSVTLSGFAVTSGGSQPTLAIAYTNTDRVLGFAMKTEREAVNGVASFAAGDVLATMEKGRMNATPEQDVAPGDPVYFRFVAGNGGTALGALRKDSDSGTAAQIARARWTTKTVAAGMATVEVNLP